MKTLTTLDTHDQYTDQYTFTLDETGMFENCVYITKALTQLWEKILKQGIQKRNVF